ncbi:hypothetical protein TeGR_g2613, partial [Tetraparma gracilis]
MHSLSLLGHSPALLRCAALGSSPCGAAELAAAAAAGPLIVAAPHTLVLAELPSGAPLVLSPHSPLPASAVLYNYESIPPPEEFGGASSGALDHPSLASEAVLELYRRHPLLDYSESNLANYPAHNLVGTHVPLGPGGVAAAGVRSGGALVARDIPVLFAGTLTPPRLAVVTSLRDAGVPVHAPTTATWGLYGAPLAQLAGRAAVVLSLNAWGGGGEWKAT